MEKRKLEINEENVRLDKFIMNSISDLSRTLIQEYIKEGHVLVNGKIEKASYKIKMNDAIEITIPDNKEMDVLPEDIPLDIVYEDQDVIVVNKPSGMIVHPSAGIYSGTLVNALLYHCKDLSGINGVNRPGIVHRIDKETSGLLMVAKNDKAHKSLSEQLKEIRIQIHIGFLDPGEAVDGGTVEHAFIVQYTIQLTGCHCNIFQIAKQIRELQTDEFHILFFHKTDDIFLGIIVHRYPRFCAACLLLFHGADASVKNTYTNYSNACFVLSMRSSPHLRYYVGGPAHTIYKDHPIIPRRLKNECKYKDRRTSQKRTALYRNLRRAGGVVHHITVNAVVAGQGYGCLLWDTGFP